MYLGLSLTLSGHSASTISGLRQQTVCFRATELAESGRFSILEAITFYSFLPSLSLKVTRSGFDTLHFKAAANRVPKCNNCIKSPLGGMPHSLVLVHVSEVARFSEVRGRCNKESFFFFFFPPTGSCWVLSICLTVPRFHYHYFN